MELRHIRYFAAVAEELHVTRAAERLHIAQPALTAQIRELERELETRLIQRSGRGIKLTAAGEVFYVDSMDILNRVSLASRRVLDAADGRIGRVIVGLTESSAFFDDATRALNQYKTAWPNVDIQLVQSHSANLIMDLVAGRIDAAFARPGKLRNNSIRVHRVFAEPLYVVLPQRHSLAKSDSISLKDLAGHPLILASGGDRVSPIEHKLREICEKRNLPMNIVQRTPELTMAVNLVSSGFGISVVPRSLRAIKREEVVYRPLTSTPRVHAETVFITRSEESSPAVLNLCKVVMTTGRRTASRPPT